MNEFSNRSVSKKSAAFRFISNRRLPVLILSAACLTAGGAGGFWLAASKTTAEKAAALSVAPETLSASFAAVAKRVEPAVVNIDTKTNALEVAANKAAPAPPKNNSNNSDDEDGAAILEYFRRQLPARPSYSVGSGFIVDPRGYILTNYHVIEDTNKITTRLQSGEEYVATIVGTDEETDLAVLKINAGKDLPAVKLGDSAIAEVGDWVLAIGSPFGLDQTVTAGIISQVGRETPYSSSSFQKFIQTDAAINRGNSGGPLVNMNGEVVGVNSQIATSTGDYNGIGFALPSSEAAYVYNQILREGRVRRGYLGVLLDSVKPEYAKIYNLPEAKGAIISEVREEKGAAATAGLQENDIIIRFNNQPVENSRDLIHKVASTPPGDRVSVVYLREIADKLEERTATVVLAERLLSRDGRILKPRSDKPEIENKQSLGLSLTELTAQTAASNKLNGLAGVLVKEVDPNGIVADVKGIGRDQAVSKNDLITRVNRVPVKSIQEFETAVKNFKTGDAVVLHIAYYVPANKKISTRIVQFTFQ